MVSELLPLHPIGSARSGESIYLMKLRHKPYSLVCGERRVNVRQGDYDFLGAAKDAEAVGNGDLGDVYRAAHRVRRIVAKHFDLPGDETGEELLRLHGPAQAREVAKRVRAMEKSIRAGVYLLRKARA